jgi:hypothetical protein
VYQGTRHNPPSCKTNKNRSTESLSYLYTYSDQAPTLTVSGTPVWPAVRCRQCFILLPPIGGFGTPVHQPQGNLPGGSTPGEEVVLCSSTPPDPVVATNVEPIEWVRLGSPTDWNVTFPGSSPCSNGASFANSGTTVCTVSGTPGITYNYRYSGSNRCQGSGSITISAPVTTQ